LPPDYEQILFQQYQDCRQGRRTVQTYVEEFHILSFHNNLLETEVQQVARFVGGLRLNIQDRLSMHTIYSFDTTHTTTNKRKFPMNPPPPASSTKIPSGSKMPMTTAGAVPPETPRNPYARPNLDKCYRCRQLGHHFNQCPRRGTVDLIGSREEADLEVKG
jgi:hypothetical protein